MNFKPEPGQTNVQITERSLQIAKEVETRVKTKEKLFEPKLIAGVIGSAGYLGP
jgi:hypothetical protein